MIQEGKYSVIFKSLEEFKKDSEFDSIYMIIKQNDSIKDQADFYKQFFSAENELEGISYTRT